MNPFISEMLGTMFILIFGGGVVANVLLNKSKGQNGGWIVITFGWAIGVFVGVYVASKSSGAHLNPAISIALAAIGKFSWAEVPLYILGQLSGAMLGAFIVWLAYKQHFDETPNPELKMAIFCTAPAIRKPIFNLITEIIGTMVLVMGVLFMYQADNSLGALDALPVALLVLGIGLSLGGPTGYAINPARDLGPRIIHALLPIKDKAPSDWSYSWIPILGPIAGAVLAAFLYQWIVQ